MPKNRPGKTLRIVGLFRTGRRSCLVEDF